MQKKENLSFCLRLLCKLKGLIGLENYIPDWYSRKNIASDWILIILVFLLVFGSVCFLAIKTWELFGM